MSDKFIHRYSQILEMLYEAHREGSITKDEKIIFKKMITQKSAEFEDFIEYTKFYEKANYIKKLKDFIKESCYLCSTDSSEKNLNKKSLKFDSNKNLNNGNNPENNITVEFFSEKDD